MTDPIRDAAIEAAAKALFENDTNHRHAVAWDKIPEAHEVWREPVSPLVDAVLAVVGPKYRAEGLRDLARKLYERGHLRVSRDDMAQLVMARADAEEGA